MSGTCGAARGGGAISTWEEYRTRLAARPCQSNYTPSLGYPESTLIECTCSTRPHHDRCPGDARAVGALVHQCGVCGVWYERTEAEAVRGRTRGRCKCEATGDIRDFDIGGMVVPKGHYSNGARRVRAIDRIKSTLVIDGVTGERSSADWEPQWMLARAPSGSARAVDADWR